MLISVSLRPISLEPRLSIPDFVSQLFSQATGFPFRFCLAAFLQSCETKSGTESLGSRLQTHSVTVSEPHTVKSSVREPHTRIVNMSEPQTLSTTVSEPHSGKSSVGEPHTRIVNMSEPQTLSTTVSEPHSCKSSVSEPHTHIHNVNISEPQTH